MRNNALVMSPWRQSIWVSHEIGIIIPPALALASNQLQGPGLGGKAGEINCGYTKLAGELLHLRLSAPGCLAPLVGRWGLWFRDPWIPRSHLTLSPSIHWVGKSDQRGLLGKSSVLERTSVSSSSSATTFLLSPVPGLVSMPGCREHRLPEAPEPGQPFPPRRGPRHCVSQNSFPFILAAQGRKPYSALGARLSPLLPT